jgi:hypothetical protein
VVSGRAGGSASGQVVPVLGGPRVASKMACQGSFQGHAVGKWMVIHRAEVAILAGMLMMRRRIVEVVPLAGLPPAMVPSGPGQVECDDGEDEPGGVGVRPAGGQVGEGGAWPVRRPRSSTRTPSATRTPVTGASDSFTDGIAGRASPAGPL